MIFKTIFTEIWVRNCYSENEGIDGELDYVQIQHIPETAKPLSLSKKIWELKHFYTYLIVVSKETHFPLKLPMDMR